MTSKPKSKIVTIHAVKDTGSAAQPATGEFSGHASGQREALLHHFRRETPAKWGRFLHAHFRGPADVAMFFDRDEKTARNWWAGTHRPTSDVTIVALLEFPVGFQAYMLAAE